MHFYIFKKCKANREHTNTSKIKATLQLGVKPQRKFFNCATEALKIVCNQSFKTVQLDRLMTGNNNFQELGYLQDLDFFNLKTNPLPNVEGQNPTA